MGFFLCVERKCEATWQMRYYVGHWSYWIFSTTETRAHSKLSFDTKIIKCVTFLHISVLSLLDYIGSIRTKLRDCKGHTGQHYYPWSITSVKKNKKNLGQKMSMKYQYFLLKAYSSGILQGSHMKKKFLVHLLPNPVRILYS